MAIFDYMIEALEASTEILHRYKQTLAYAGCAVAWLCSMLQATHCSFLGIVGSPTRFGLFSRSFDDQNGEFLGCIRYGANEVDDFDSSLRAGRSFGVFTVLYLTMVLLSSAICAVMVPRTPRRLWSANKFLLSAAALSQMLTLLAAGSRVCSNLEEEPCELVGVGILGIFNIVVLLLLCVTFWSLDPPDLKWLRIVVPAPAQQTVASQTEPNCIGRLSSKDPTRFRSIFTGLTLLAMVMSAVTLRRCTFLMVNATGYGPTNISSGLGLYTQAVQVQGSFVGCVAYPSSFSFDPPFKTARFFATLSVVLATGSFLAAVASLFRKAIQRYTWVTMRVLLPLASLSLLLSTTAFSSDNCNLRGVTSCRLGSSGVLLVFIVLLLAFLSFLVWSQPCPTSHLLEIVADTKAENDLEQQSSKDETVIVGNPRLMHKHEPIIEEEELSDSDEEKAKNSPLKSQTGTSGGSHTCSSGEREGQNAIFRDSDDESSTLSTKSSESQAVTYHIEYIGDTKKTTKIITGKNGVLSEVATIEKVDSFDCALSVESHVTE